MTKTDVARHHREVAAQAMSDAGRFAIDDPKRATFIAEAQVHALLAQSEEQRTANLLAAYGTFSLTDAHLTALVARLGLA